MSHYRTTYHSDFSTPPADVFDDQDQPRHGSHRYAEPCSQCHRICRCVRTGRNVSQIEPPSRRSSCCSTNSRIRSIRQLDYTSPPSSSVARRDCHCRCKCCNAPKQKHSVDRLSPTLMRRPRADSYQNFHGLSHDSFKRLSADVCRCQRPKRVSNAESQCISCMLRSEDPIKRHRMDRPISRLSLCRSYDNNEPTCTPNRSTSRLRFSDQTSVTSETNQQTAVEEAATQEDVHEKV
ncbi:uncharacterized protein LOC129758649 [Uranotaenia lowii]|uniref:uncharacterized protein LOC129758649 n=1 Tax=Uranotaenia lowii TaxID=190385 RepID=UPI00247ADEEC|nr:uncharacterized protein LOC129758649 [Uranotaenia lowii]